MGMGLLRDRSRKIVFCFHTWRSTGFALITALSTGSLPKRPHQSSIYGINPFEIQIGRMQNILARTSFWSEPNFQAQIIIPKWESFRDVFPCRTLSLHFFYNSEKVN